MKLHTQNSNRQIPLMVFGFFLATITLVFSGCLSDQRAEESSNSVNEMIDELSGIENEEQALIEAELKNEDLDDSDLDLDDVLNDLDPDLDQGEEAQEVSYTFGSALDELFRDFEALANEEEGLVNKTLEENENALTSDLEDAMNDAAGAV